MKYMVVVFFLSGLRVFTFTSLMTKILMMITKEWNDK